MLQLKRARNGPLPGIRAWVVVLAGVLAGVAQLQAASTNAEIEQKRQETLLTAARKYFPADAAGDAPKRIFRLTRDQIDTTVAWLLPRHYERSIKTRMSSDPRQTNYEYAELLPLNAANLGAVTGWIGDIAARVRKNPVDVIDCAAKGNDPACLEAAARRFVLKAFRHDIEEERIAAFVAFYRERAKSNLAQAAGDLVEVVLNSPSFLFRKELEVDRHSRLLPAPLLQSLTYTIADAPPEQLGFDATRPGQYIGKGADPRPLVERLVASKEGREKLVRFFKAWLEVKEPDEFTISKEEYKEFNGDLAKAMSDETDRFLRQQLDTGFAKAVPRLQDITQATQSLVSGRMADIYKVKVDPKAPAKPVSLDPAQRLGIFTQPAVIASHSGPVGTRPIKRGVFWVRKVMCMEMEPPPNGVDSTLYDAPHTTERQRIETVTRQKDCIGCHKVIDPLGFFQESYDALGRWRTTDNGHAIDTSIMIDFLDEGAARTATAVEALRVFTESLMFKQCFVRQLFRFYVGRSEEPSDDPLLRRMFLGLVANDDLLLLVKELAMSGPVGRRAIGQAAK